jgi:hypothetical protein
VSSVLRISNALKAGRRLGLSCARLFCAFVVLTGLVRAGGRYFYCDAFGLLTFDPCASADGQTPPCPLESLQSQPEDCCQQIVLPALPDGAPTQSASVPPAGVVATLPAADHRVAWGGLEAPPIPDARCPRGPPASAAVRRVQLMVSLT